MTMKSVRQLASLTTVLVALGALSVSVEPAAAQTPRQSPTTLTSETPARIEPTNEGFDYTRRTVMIPMRDGVKLHTVILVPKNAAKVTGRAGQRRSC